MKVTLAPALPRNWRSLPGVHGVVGEHDIRFTRRARLAAKLLVFRHHRDMRAFWSAALGFDIGRKCHGVVNRLSRESIRITKSGKQSHEIVYDPRYYCVIGLLKSRLSMEVISHESVHAGFAYAKRASRAPWSAYAREFDEEAIAYPAGAIARSINAFLHDNGLYE